jgi:hypothetical protein
MSKHFNPEDYLGPDGLKVSQLSRDTLEQELCKTYDLLSAILDASTLKDIAESIELARRDFTL